MIWIKNVHLVCGGGKAGLAWDTCKVGTYVSFLVFSKRTWVGGNACTWSRWDAQTFTCNEEWAKKRNRSNHHFAVVVQETKSRLARRRQRRSAKRDDTFTGQLWRLLLDKWSTRGEDGKCVDYWQHVLFGSTQWVETQEAKVQGHHAECWVHYRYNFVWYDYIKQFRLNQTYPDPKP